MDPKRPVSFLHSIGQYKPGENFEQWRAEGICLPLALKEIMDIVPQYTIAGMIAVKRKEIEDAEHHESRNLIGRQSHFVELLQDARNELEAGKIPHEEIDNCIEARRFVPIRVERMVAEPDQVVWDRWEWKRNDIYCNWDQPRHLLPF